MKWNTRIRALYHTEAIISRTVIAHERNGFELELPCLCPPAAIATLGFCITRKR